MAPLLEETNCRINLIFQLKKLSNLKLRVAVTLCWKKNQKFFCCNKYFYYNGLISKVFWFAFNNSFFHIVSILITFLLHTHRTVTHSIQHRKLDQFFFYFDCILRSTGRCFWGIKQNDLQTPLRFNWQIVHFLRIIIQLLVDSTCRNGGGSRIGLNILHNNRFLIRFFVRHLFWYFIRYLIGWLDRFIDRRWIWFLAGHSIRFFRLQFFEDINQIIDANQITIFVITDAPNTAVVDFDVIRQHNGFGKID